MTSDARRKVEASFCEDCDEWYGPDESPCVHATAIAEGIKHCFVTCGRCGLICTPSYASTHAAHCGQHPIPFTRYCSDCSGWYGAGEGCECETGSLTPEPIRGAILDAAKGHTLGDRNTTHGDPIPAMELFMDLARPIIDTKDLPEAVRGALILNAYKIARILHNPYHRDSYEDGCAYIAIAGEAAERSRSGH